MDAQRWIQLGAVVTALVPFLTAGVKKLLGSTRYNAILPLVSGILLTLGGAMTQGQVQGWNDLLPIILTGLAGGGLGSSARDVWAKTLRIQGAGAPVSCLLLLAACLLGVSGCALMPVLPGADLMSGIHQFTRDDAAAALEMARGAGDEVAARCYQGLIAVMDAEAQAKPPQVKGALSAFQVTRGIVEHKTMNAVAEQINLACSPLVVDVGTTLGRFGLLTAPGGGILGRLLP